MPKGLVQRGIRRAGVQSGAIVGVLATTGVAVTLASSGGTVQRDLGLAIFSGAIVGGALVAVESLLAGAAEQRAAHASLLGQLSTTIELAGIDLSDRPLPDVYLPGRAFVAARLERTQLSGAKLLFGDFRHAQMAGALLVGADLSGSTLAFGHLEHSDLRGASLRDADLSDATLDGADLRGADLVGARLQRTSLVGADLRDAHLSACYLEGADLTEAKIAGATLVGNQHDSTTRWPTAIGEPPASVPVHQDAINEMDLASYLAWRARSGLAPEGERPG